jgi:hypothetical protein
MSWAIGIDAPDQRALQMGPKRWNAASNKASTDRSGQKTVSFRSPSERWLTAVVSCGKVARTGAASASGASLPERNGRSSVLINGFCSEMTTSILNMRWTNT